jgi:hypothetical protein
MNSSNDAELQAIQQLISALEPLDSGAKGRVIAYVFQRLGLSSAALPTDPGAAAATPSVTAPTGTPRVVDIRTFASEKAPSSQTERTVLVAFYLSELAPKAARKSEISGADLEKYQKQAGLRAPTNTRHALFSARHAGYLDSAGHGKYKLNAVGYNLVAHGLPSSGGSAAPAVTSPRRKSRNGRPKKAARKKTTHKKSPRKKRR